MEKLSSTPYVDEQDFAISYNGNDEDPTISTDQEN